MQKWVRPGKPTIFIWWSSAVKFLNAPVRKRFAGRHEKRLRLLPATSQDFKSQALWRFRHCVCAAWTPLGSATNSCAIAVSPTKSRHAFWGPCCTLEHGRSPHLGDVLLKPPTHKAKKTRGPYMT